MYFLSISLIVFYGICIYTHRKAVKKAHIDHSRTIETVDLIISFIPVVNLISTMVISTVWFDSKKREESHTVKRYFGIK